MRHELSEPTRSSGAGWPAAYDCSLWSAIVTLVSGSFMLNRPPKPQHRWSASHVDLLHPSTASSSATGWSSMRNSRSMWQEWW
jgi:hypothetical protein